MMMGATKRRVGWHDQGKVGGSGETVTINGSWTANVSLAVTQLSIGGGAQIQGDVRYQSANEASIAPARGSAANESERSRQRKSNGSQGRGLGPRLLIAMAHAALLWRIAHVDLASRFSKHGGPDGQEPVDEYRRRFFILAAHSVL